MRFAGTLRDAHPVSCSRADTEIASDRGGGAGTRRARRWRMEESLVSPRQECNRVATS